MNPTEIRKEQIRLQNERTEILEEKRTIDVRRTELNNSVRGRRLPKAEYEAICAEQVQLAKSMCAIDRKLQDTKSKLRELAALEDEIFHNSGESHKTIATAEDVVKPTVIQLVAIRKHYQDFAADPTRVASMRTMAAEFVLKLNPVIQLAVNS